MATCLRMRTPPAVRWALAATLCLTTLGCGSSSDTAKTPAYASGFVTVASGVRLAYLDFRGSGEPLVLLAGAGDTAHVFETFAPHLDKFHCIALTRRGFGESSQPAGGYDPTTLAGDLHAALDALGIARASFVVHSIAGVEMTRFAVTYPDQVDRIVYLDAAYDWASQVENPPPGTPPVPPNPGAGDLASPEAFAAYLARIQGVPSFPVSEVKATNVFGSNGHYARPVTPPSITTAFANAAATESPDYGSLGKPVLAIFTVPDTATDMFPWLTPASDQWDVAQAYFPGARALLAAQRAAFKAARPDATVTELPHVPHFLFLAEPDATADAVLSFLAQ